MPLKHFFKINVYNTHTHIQHTFLDFGCSSTSLLSGSLSSLSISSQLSRISSSYVRHEHAWGGLYEVCLRGVHPSNVHVREASVRQVCACVSEVRKHVWDIGTYMYMYMFMYIYGHVHMCVCSMYCTWMTLKFMVHNMALAEGLLKMREWFDLYMQHSR